MSGYARLKVWALLTKISFEGQLAWHITPDGRGRLPPGPKSEHTLSNHFLSPAAKLPAVIRDGEEQHGQNRGAGLEPNRRRCRCRARAGYCRNRGLHENLRARQANGVPSEQRQLSAAACDQECARGLAKAECGRRR